MKRLKIKDTFHKIIDGFDVNESSREVKYSNVKIDFTGKGIADLPLKYQECQLVEGEFRHIEADEGQRIEGTNLQVNQNEEKLSELEYIKGQTTQDGTPTPSTPQPINVVSGRQVVSVCGKNFLDLSIFSVASSFYNVSDNNVEVIAGDNRGYASIENYLILPSGTYTIMSKTQIPRLQITDRNTGNALINVYQKTIQTFTLNETTSIIIKFLNQSGVSYPFTIEKPMLVKGEYNSYSIDFEEYKGNNYDINLGANLLDTTSLNTIKSINVGGTWNNNVYTLNGVEFTYNDDGSVTATGTASANINFYFSRSGNYAHTTLPSGTYYFTSHEETGSNSTWKTQFSINGTGYNVFGNGTSKEISKTLTEDTPIYAYIVIYSGKNPNGATFYPMISKNYGIKWHPYKTPIELCKLETYQDYIAKATGKNLFDKNNVNVLNAYFTASTTTITSNEYNRTIYIPCKPNTNYVISRRKGSFFLSGYTKETPNINVQVYGIPTSTPSIDTNYYYQVVSTGEDATHLVSRITNISSDTITLQEIYDSLQIEEGTAPSQYEPFGEGWYLHKEIGKIVLTGASSESWSINGTGTSNWFYWLRYITTNINTNDRSKLKSNYYPYGNVITSTTDNGLWISTDNLRIRWGTEDTISNFKTWLSTHNVNVYYPLATPTITEITDEELITQLENIKLIYGLNNINVSSLNLEGLIGLHYNYQIEQDIEKVNEVIYTGYINNYTLPKMKNKLEYRELDIDLLSPLALATLRTADAVGTYNLQPLIKEILQPLIDDGFILKELNIGNNQITINFLTETIESALNKLSNKFNFWWYIDKNKNIYINSINYLFNKNVVLTYDDDNKINGLIDFTPSMESIDYCNTIDFTNVRLITSSLFQKQVYRHIDAGDLYSPNYYNPIMRYESIEPGQEIEFDIPFIINTNRYDTSETSYLNEQFYFRLYNMTQESGGFEPQYTLLVELKGNKDNNVIIPSNASIADTYNEDKEFVFVRDSFFSNLIIGMKYNGNDTINVGIVQSCTALMYAKVRINNNNEIEVNKDIISKTGIVEKQIDMNEQWHTYNELLEIANSLIKKNDVNVEKVEIKTDIENNLKIGDIISIDKNAFLTYGQFIITDKRRTNYDNVDRWDYKMSNTNILESYIDLFRSTEEEEQVDKLINLITGDYSTEGILEKYEVEVQ